MAEASNRVRGLIERGAGVLAPDDAALARGLVVGDDQDQPPAMVERFRASGLAHLTAVSGQNVAFVLAAAGPLLRRSRPLSRWMLTLGLIGWFVLLTRAEPSVMRAGTMAALSATAFLLGRQREPVRLLALAVAGLLLLDPLLAWSVGFWLSVGATAGVTAIGPWLAPRLGALGPLALPVAVTVGAQLGVALPSLLVFGRLSLVGTVANLVAVPVAGLVMLYGLPACLVAGVVPVVAPVVMAPVAVGVRWIDAVATIGSAVEPGPPWSWLGWAGVAAVLAALAWRGRRHSPCQIFAGRTTRMSAAAQKSSVPAVTRRSACWPATRRLSIVLRAVNWAGNRADYRDGTDAVNFRQPRTVQRRAAAVPRRRRPHPVPRRRRSAPRPSSTTAPAS